MRREKEKDSDPASSGLDIEEEDFFFSSSRKEKNAETDNSSSSSPRAPTSTASSSASPSADADDVPWYLKVDVPKHPTLVPQEHPLPDIPPNSPTLMQPLLTFVADDLGLDDLTLLDLRALDPPAALGPELLMLFGTARSERHLHVSADRLVRWLRRFGIQANADGLLGRNELKIKLRRKARRAKLLGNLGPATGTVDDGISTQWICLHAGTIGRSGAGEGSRLDAEGRVSGFGSTRTGGTTVVVQMLTEGKRRQLDLETLWSRSLQRSLRRRAEEGEDMRGLEAAPKEQEERPEEDLFAANSGSPASALSTLSPSGTAATQKQQRRQFSMAARRLAVNANDDIVTKLTQSELRADDLPQIEQALSRSADDRIGLLEELARYLDSLPSAAVLEALGPPVAVQPNSSLEVGEGAEMPEQDRATATPPFIRAAHYCLRGLLPQDTWAFRARVHGTAMAHGHRDYTLGGMTKLVGEMQRGGLACPRDLAGHLLRCIFSVRRRDNDGTAGGAAPALGTQQRQRLTALRLLETLHERGEPILAADFVADVIVAVARSSRRRASPYGKPVPPTEADTAHGQLQATLEELLRQAAAAPALPSSRASSPGTPGRLGCPNDASLVQLLAAYADQNDWDRFWNIAWRLPPQHRRARSAALYEFVYRRAAATRRQDRCLDALRRCFQEMVREDPPVLPRGPVREALLACIRVADPQAESLLQILKQAGSPGQDERRMKRLENRECVLLLRAVEEMNQQTV